MLVDALNLGGVGGLPEVLDGYKPLGCRLVSHQLRYWIVPVPPRGARLRVCMRMASGLRVLAASVVLQWSGFFAWSLPGVCVRSVDQPASLHSPCLLGMVGFRAAATARPGIRCRDGPETAAGGLHLCWCGFQRRRDGQLGRTQHCLHHTVLGMGWDGCMNEFSVGARSRYWLLSYLSRWMAAGRLEWATLVVPAVL